MKKKAIGFVAAISILGGTWVLRIADIVSDKILFWAFLVLLMAAASVLFSFLATEEFKRSTYSQRQIDCINTLHSRECDQEKRATYAYAVKMGRIGMATCGVIFVLLQDVTWRHQLVIGVFWLFGVALVGYLSPIAWRFGREYLRHRKAAKVQP